MRHWLACLVLFASSTPMFGQPAPVCGSSVPYGNNSAAGHYVAVNSVKIYYEVYGTGPALLLLHGNGGSIARGGCQIEFFAPKRRVIAVDSRGHGKSDDGPGALTFEQQADDFIAVLDAERVDRADVFGHSDGGILALELGIRHPNRVGKIVASGPNLRPDATALYESEIANMRIGLAQATAKLDAHDTTRDWNRQKRQRELDLNEPHISLDAVRSINREEQLIRQSELFLQTDRRFHAF